MALAVRTQTGSDRHMQGERCCERHGHRTALGAARCCALLTTFHLEQRLVASFHHALELKYSFWIHPTPAACSSALWPLQAFPPAASRRPCSAPGLLHQPYAVSPGCVYPRHDPRSTRRPQLLQRGRQLAACPTPTSPSWHPRRQACWRLSLESPRLWTSWPSGGSSAERSGLQHSQLRGSCVPVLKARASRLACGSG